ncbi:MAG: L-arabinose ABC transporter permease AraH [Spirochaetota bacterium]
MSSNRRISQGLQKRKEDFPSQLISRAAEKSSFLIIFIFLFTIFSIFVPHFFSVINIIGLALSISMAGMVACTMLFCLAAGDFDLSVESVIAFSGVFTTVIINSTGSVTAGILSGILAGGIVGYINGFLIAKFQMNALITTLATMQIVRGLGFIVSQGSAVGVYKPIFFVLGTGRVLGIPNPIWFTIIMFIIFGFLLNRTSFGRNTLAIGGNMEASRLAGISVEKIKIMIFMIQGLAAGLAGVILASRMTSGQPNTSVGFSLDVISACVLGGVSLSGGVATVSGMIVGVLIMGTVQNVMNLLNIPTFYQYLVRGMILILAVLLDKLRQKNSYVV